MAQRTHVSPSRHIREIKPTSQNWDRSFNWKPRGFWYEVNSDWRRWLKGEGYGSYQVGNRTRRGMYLHRVHLHHCKVLKISSVEMLDAFDREYRTNKTSEIISGIMGLDFSLNEVDWERLSRQYDGIEIAPYLWERRLSVDMRWYYSWDCASGCIWRPKDATVSLIRKLG